jgi:hypothetical protein
VNILTDELPSTVEIAGTEYQIVTDFRACLKTILAYEDNDLTPQEKQSVLLSNLYPVIPENIQAAFEQANRFLNGGKELEESSAPRLYSFAKDSDFIFSAFRQTHGIDLQKAELHWWSFLALFMDLGSETTFCQLVSLRKRIKTGKATKEERQAAREMGELIDVPEIDTRSIEEKLAEQEFLRLVAKGRK